MSISRNTAPGRCAPDPFAGSIFPRLAGSSHLRRVLEALVHRGALSEINVPALTIAAWYDIFLGGSLRNYIGIRLHGGSEAARQGQRLLVTIGGHAGPGRKIGEVDFTAAAEFDEDELILSWYDHLFRNAANEFGNTKP
ncbi:MAG: hypothetical protein DMG70_13895, partial [Acidobacteria bacterium]